MAEKEGSLPFKDLKVVETAQGVAGPHCGRFLAALGADVIKIEPPSGDWSRKLAPFLGESENIESSAIYQYNNSGKKSVILDLSVPTGISKLSDLVSKADILIEDWDLYSRRINGISADTFTCLNPQLID